MTIAELELKLNREGVNPDYYSFYDYDVNDSVCLYKQHDVWPVYYLERGTRFDYIEHSTESDACKDVYDRVKEFP